MKAGLAPIPGGDGRFLLAAAFTVVFYDHGRCCLRSIGLTPILTPILSTNG